MKYIKLKNTDDTISQTVLGTDGYADSVKKETAINLMDKYIELGGNVIDTALLYGGEYDNTSEKLIGEWMKKNKKRNHIFLSTKGGHPRTHSMDISRLSAKEIEGDIDISLKNLKTDHIDIYWLHRDDESLPVDNIMDTMDMLVKKGKTRYFGMSNWTHKRIDEANKYAREHNITQIISSQIQYSPARAVVENNDPTLVLMNDDEYNYFKTHNMSVFAFASQAKGFFSKIDAGGIENLSPKARTRYLCDANIEMYKRIKKISEAHNATVAETVIATLLNDKKIQTLPIVGCKTVLQLEESLKGADLELSQAEVDYILKIKNKTDI